MGQKLEILRDYFIDGKGKQTIAKERDISRNTVKAYINEFILAKGDLLRKYKNHPELTYKLIEEMVGMPKYNTENRQSTKLTEEHKEFIKKCLMFYSMT